MRKMRRPEPMTQARWRLFRSQRSMMRRGQPAVFRRRERARPMPAAGLFLKKAAVVIDIKKKMRT
jgi:hypothetical protein